MPFPSPFHSRTSRHCTSYRWKDWAGHYAVCSYDICHEPEYFALRHSAGLIDVSPLFKYEVTGRDAGRFLSRVMAKDVRALKPGRVTYLCWCDDDGKVIDDGTVARLGEDHYRVTAAEPSFGWFERFRRRYDVRIEDVSTQLGALSLQGPTSRDILRIASDADMDALRFFGVVEAKIGSTPVWISRTGYTGDLGYEIWVDARDGEAVYDRIMEAGQQHRILPCGLDAMDVTRIEAGFIMNGVDYNSAHHCMIEERKSSPYEIGLGWCVQLDREPFVGQEALRREKEKGPTKMLVGLDVDWVETEEIFARYGLPPEVKTNAWRDGRPVYDGAGEWVGYATSGAWSPTLKKNLALAQVRSGLAKPGTRLKIEMTVEYRRHTVTATVVPLPFFDPPRKKA